VNEFGLPHKSANIFARKYSFPMAFQKMPFKYAVLDSNFSNDLINIRLALLTVRSVHNCCNRSTIIFCKVNDKRFQVSRNAACVQKNIAGTINSVYLPFDTPFMTLNCF